MKKYIPFVVIVLVILIGCDKSDDNSGDPGIIPDSCINAIVIDKNNVKWVGTNSGLYVYTNSELTPVNVTTYDKVLSLLYEESSDILWVGTEQGLFKATILGTAITENPEIPEFNLSSTSIQCAYPDTNTGIWFGADLGLTFNKNESWKNDSFRVNIKNMLFPMGAENWKINSISSWDGDYYFATTGGCLYRAFGLNNSVDAFSGASQWIPPYNGLNTTTNMYVVFVDSKGNQWMGGENGVQVHTGHEPKDQTTFTYYNDELADSVIHAIAEAPDGKIWVGTEKGLSVFNGSSWTTITEEMPDLWINTIAFDQDGSAWVGTKKGIKNIK